MGASLGPGAATPAAAARAVPRRGRRSRPRDVEARSIAVDGGRDRERLLVGVQQRDWHRARLAKVDVAAILAHTWQFSSIALSFLRNQTTAIGYAGTVDTQTLQTRISFTPNRRLTAYTQPAVIRSTSRPFEATVYRLSAGARYAISSLFDATVAYNHDSQKGAFDPMRPDANLSRATLSFGFAARWNNPESTR